MFSNISGLGQLDWVDGNKQISVCVYFPDNRSEAKLITARA